MSANYYKELKKTDYSLRQQVSVIYDFLARGGTPMFTYFPSSVLGPVWLGAAQVLCMQPQSLWVHTCIHLVACRRQFHWSLPSLLALTIFMFPLWLDPLVLRRVSLSFLRLLLSCVFVPAMRKLMPPNQVYVFDHLSLSWQCYFGMW